jgi:hypothetical protein
LHQVHRLAVRERAMAELRLIEPSRAIDDMRGAGARISAEDDKDTAEKVQRPLRPANTAAIASAPQTPSAHPPHSTRFAAPPEAPPTEARPVELDPPHSAKLVDAEREAWAASFASGGAVAANAALMDTAPLADSRAVSVTAEAIVVPHTC